MGKGITKKQGSTDQVEVWVKSILPSQISDVQVKLRGRQLHIICEALHCPSMAEIAEHFTQAFHPDFLVDNLGTEYHSDLQIFLCGRAKGHRRPDWTLKLDTQGQSSFKLPRVGDELGDRPVLNVLSSYAELATPIEEPVVLQGIDQNQTKLTDHTVMEQPVLDHQGANYFINLSPSSVNQTDVDLVNHGDDLIANNDNTNVNINSPVTEHLTDYSNNNLSTTNNAIVTVNETDAIDVINPNAINISDDNNSSSAIITQTLNDILAGLGVTVQVSIVPIFRATKSNQSEKNSLHSQDTTQNTNQQPISPNTKKRLIIQCEASYNPDPSLLAEPIAQKLRELNLKDCRDALITMQVRGETTPDWSLKIDLTPPDLLLREWARWGNVIAIERILQKQLATLGIEIRATLKESTLHLFCSNTPNSDPNYQQKTLQAIARILQRVSPQGIQAATIYGCTYQDLQQTNQPASPLWIDWLDLKQPDKPDLQLTAKQLAENGNQNALGFLLNRLLNPDLDRKLQTGGVRVLLLVKNAILHIMTEAPTCPSQSQVAQPIVKFLQQFPLPDVSYVRIYGRRAGQKQIIWQKGFAYDPNINRKNLSEFNISPQELLSLSSQSMGSSGSLVLTGATNISDFTNTERLESSFNQTFRQLLLNTGLCVSNNQEVTPQYRPWVTILAIATGLFFTFSIDQLGGILLADAGKNKTPACTEVDCPGEISDNDGSKHLFNTLTTNNKENQQFTASKFTDTDTNITALLSQLYPSFRSPQLDEQLLRYQKYLLEHKRPPDILIVGSSRALRGIDPQVLESNLKQAGHGGLRVYNLGINGATMQVVDLIVRQVLTPAQLPQLIIMADGVRALNSGRVDLTYDIIASSEGYQQAISNNHLIATDKAVSANDRDVVDNTENIAQINSSQQITNNLVSIIQAKLENMSALYPYRETVKQKLLTAINTPPENLPEISAQANASDPVNNQENNTAIDNFENLNDFTNQGFLPIPAKFEPIHYYQKHPQVSGYYDRDYENFQLLGKQTDALKNLLEYTAKKDVKILFVNMPLTYEYLDQVRTAYEKEFIGYMQQLSIQHQHFTFKNLGASFLQDYDKFSDPSHLNKFGAIAVAENLAISPDITWQKLVMPESLGNR